MVNELKKIQFHDAEVNDLKLDLLHKTLDIKVLIFDEETQNYTEIKIKFEELSSVVFNNFFNNNLLIEEISSFDIVEDRLYQGKFTFLQGFSKPSCDICFNFESCKIYF